MAEFKNLKGTTKNGFEWQLPESRLDNMELIDALAEVENGNVFAVSQVVELLLGKNQKKRLYDFIRDNDGVVSATKVSETVVEILQGANDAKNS